jgi:hypothetical protein
MRKALSCFIAMILGILLFTTNNTHASCAPNIMVGSETIFACPGVTNPEIKGFSIDLEKDIITLDNYNGGGIYYLCRGTCPDVKEYTIELIGENVIDSKLSQAFPKENNVPTIIDAGFINIIPTFVGSGTLTINASDPFSFEQNDTSFGIKLAGPDYGVTPPPAQVTSPSTNEADVSVPNNSSVFEKEASSSESFFTTTTGIITLVAIPSLLMLIIIVLLIVLIRKASHNRPTMPNAPTSSLNQ